MIKKIFFIALISAVFSQANAQNLLSPSYGFSHKKTSYVTLIDGKEIKGTIKDLDREKGLIEFVKIKDGNGKKHKLDAEDIKYMYLPPSGLDKLSTAMDFLTDAQKWTDEKLDQDLLNQGYAYFELSNVKVKKKEKQLLMQLLNPEFSKKVKVYHDPYAKETASAGIGGITVAGGKAKSYYIKIGDDAAYKVQKKRYDEEFTPLWNKCKALVKKYTDVKWSELGQHVLDYSNCEE